ncbi:hypothetical protein VTN00DRAFT_3489 [Thermoascus crustaceus]|uniref:uncharacterized protein n=1 Tax=Thermoascus crustaceus TaxID=5088 RepID=UPI00374478DE
MSIRGSLSLSRIADIDVPRILHPHVEKWAEIRLDRSMVWTSPSSAPPAPPPSARSTPYERVKKRRLASGQACTSCRRRKNRCDGVRPQCGSCQSRGITCEYPACMTNQMSDGLCFLETGRDRVVASMVREVSLLNRPLPPKTDISPFMSSSADLLSSASQTASPTNTAPYKVSSSVSGNSEQTELHESRSHTSPIGASGGPDEYFGDSSTFAFVSKVQSESQQENGMHLAGKTQDRVTNVSSAQMMSIDMGLTEADMRSELPERHVADSLVDAYFSRVHPLYPFVHEGCFRVEYERMWTHVSQSPSRPSWYALLNLVFAFGCEFCDAVREEDVLAAAFPFVARARTLIFPYIFKGGNLELVQALLLMCHYLQGTLELNECWNLVGLMIRTAVSIGLHANPETGALTAVEKEVRKRVWWGCFIIDRTLSMKFGRPPSIRATDGSDVQIPLDVDDQYITKDSLLPRQPASRPSMTAFFTQTIKLAHIIDNILRDLYSTNKKAPRPTGADSPVALGTNLSHILSNAVDLDGQLQSWWQEMPDHLRHQPGVADGPDFQRQRTVMLIRYLHIRILLQRQLLLIFTRQHIEDAFLRTVTIAGSQTCISAARQTIRLICTEYHRHLLNSLWYNLHYVFTAMGVLLTLQTMDKARLKLLGYEDEEEDTLEYGMEFLRRASRTCTSSLASRYVGMLEHIHNRAKKTSDVMGGSPRRNGSSDESSQADDNRTLRASLHPEGQPALPGKLDTFCTTLDLDGVDFSDLLYGTGLPQDLLCIDSHNLGSML